MPVTEEQRKWFDHVIHQSVKVRTVQNRLDKLIHTFQGVVPENGCIEIRTLLDILHAIDKMWYKNKFIDYVKEYYGGLHVYIHDEFEEDGEVAYELAGFVQKTGRKELTFHLHRTVFNRLFPTGEEVGYHSGGLLCKSAFVCMIYVILHEFLHAVLTLGDDWGLRDDTDHHGKEFQGLLKKLYGQTDTQHGLIPELNHVHDLEELRKFATPGTLVVYYEVGKGWQDGEILSAKPLENQVVVRDQKSKVVSVLHIGTVKLK